MTTQHRLVYGHATNHDTLAFVDVGTATGEAAEIRSLAAARTWGEARRVPMTHLENPAGPECYDEDDHPDDEPFAIAELGAVVEMRWPTMVAARALDVLPKDLQERYGKVVLTVHDGEYLEVPVDSEAALIAELRERGYEATRDDELINLLDGVGLGSVAA
ncbi:hypothetical protein [Micromonospora tulbaghiae]